MNESDTNPRVNHLAKNIKERLARAGHSSMASLQEYKGIGVELTEAKPLLPHGDYLDWAKEQFNFSKQWCSCLTRLANSWSDYESARTWAEEQGMLLGRKEYSVDGALALIRQWKNALNPSPKDETKSQKRPSAAEMKALLDELRRHLDEAHAEIHKLKDQLRSGSKRSRRASQANTARQPHTAPLDQDTQARAQKAAGLWHANTYAGERASAEAALRRMADRVGYGFDAFLAACGIQRPGDWTSARAA